MLLKFEPLSCAAQAHALHGASLRTNAHEDPPPVAAPDVPDGRRRGRRSRQGGRARSQPGLPRLPRGVETWRVGRPTCRVRQVGARLLRLHRLPRRLPGARSARARAARGCRRRPGGALRVRSRPAPPRAPTSPARAATARWSSRSPPRSTESGRRATPGWPAPPARAATESVHEIVKGVAAPAQAGVTFTPGARAISERCEKCHADPAYTEKAGLKGDVVVTFHDSIHGRLVNVGSALAPACADCHGAAEKDGKGGARPIAARILARTDPGSPGRREEPRRDLRPLPRRGQRQLRPARRPPRSGPERQQDPALPPRGLLLAGGPHPDLLRRPRGPRPVRRDPPQGAHAQGRARARSGQGGAVRRALRPPPARPALAHAGRASSCSPSPAGRCAARGTAPPRPSSPRASSWRSSAGRTGRRRAPRRRGDDHRLRRLPPPLPASCRREADAALLDGARRRGTSSTSATTSSSCSA